MPITSKLIKGKYYEVPLGEDTRIIDNSKSSMPTMRVVRLTREWAKTYALGFERAKTNRGSAGISHILTLQTEAERTLRDTYSVTSERREIFEEVVTLNIDARTRSEISFFWKEVHQEGTVLLSGPDLEVEIPYDVVVRVTFDQQQVDAL